MAWNDAANNQEM